MQATAKTNGHGLRDRLSHLTYAQAVRSLGHDGDRLLRAGGAFDIDIDEQVRLGARSLRLTLGDAVATIAPSDGAPNRLDWNCSRCRGACEHVGAAFSLVLEEKVALGLAAPPTESVPLERLSDAELIQRAVAERQERARSEKMSLRPIAPNELWTDYLVASPVSGKTYRVALRGWAPGDSYCNCPDFRKNTLGTCKHVLAVQARARKGFGTAARRQPFRPTIVAVYLRYGPTVELRLQAPPRLIDAAASIVAPFADRPIDDAAGLVRSLAKLAALGVEYTIYPDAEEYIDQQLHQQRLAALVAEIRRDPRRHPLRTTLLKAELLPYQLDGIAFAAGAGRAILADDMGLGKTIQGIGVAELLRREANVRRVLLVCPASLKAQWRAEIERFSDLDCDLVLGGAAERAGQYDSGRFFTVCNYEQVLRDILAIERVAWDLIILDEGQRIKNWESKTSRVLKGLRSRFALVLSGTPLENRLEELYSVTQFIDDRRLGPAFRFFHQHRVVDDKGKPLGYRNLSELRERLRPVLLRRTRASVMQELPPRSTEIVRIAPTDEQRELHGAHLRVVSSIVRKPFISEMDLLRLRKALLMCRMAANSTFLVDKREPGYSSKIATLADLLSALLAESDRKIVLFSEWTTMLGLIEPLIRACDADFARLDGSIPQAQRTRLVHRFQNDPDCRVFITTNAGATGLNLQAANTVVNVDLPWNPAILEQRIARAHRMGQKRPVQAYLLVTDQTIEEALLRTLSAKKDLALAALDVESDVDQVDLVNHGSELRNRLEVLLGAAPEAPVDRSAQAEAEATAARLARREQIALAGGELLSAAVSLVDQLLPPGGDAEKTNSVAAALRERLSECMDRDERGQLKLTLALPNAGALDRLAASLARLLSVGASAAG